MTILHCINLNWWEYFYVQAKYLVIILFLDSVLTILCGICISDLESIVHLQSVVIVIVISALHYMWCGKQSQNCNTTALNSITMKTPSIAIHYKIWVCVARQGNQKPIKKLILGSLLMNIQKLNKLGSRVLLFLVSVWLIKNKESLLFI